LLDTYLSRTKRLLQIPNAPVQLYSDSDLTDYINQARAQLAGDAECIRAVCAQAMVPTSGGPYGFSTLAPPSSVGILSVLNVRMAWTLISGATRKIMNPWPWEYFNWYYLNLNTIPTGRPTEWAQFGQGDQGTLFFYPTPDLAYTLQCDAVCLPVPLTSDFSIEAIPFPWTDCVPYFAAYLALLSAQTGQRQADANRMMERYEEFKKRARTQSTPSVLSFQYEQTGMVFPPSPEGVPPPGGGRQ
jgi:hypothetical protein